MIADSGRQIKQNRTIGPQETGFYHLTGWAVTSTPILSALIENTPFEMSNYFSSFQAECNQIREWLIGELLNCGFAVRFR